MASSLLDLANNLSERIHRIKYIFEYYDKKLGKCEIKYKHCNGFLEYSNFQDDLIKYKCLVCKKNCQKMFNKRLKERFFNTYKFSNHDNNEFILLLRKVIYPDECMEDWEKSNEMSLPEKENFYSHLNMEDITDAAYAHAKRV